MNLLYTHRDNPTPDFETQILASMSESPREAYQLFQNYLEADIDPQQQALFTPPLLKQVNSLNKAYLRRNAFLELIDLPEIKELITEMITNGVTDSDSRIFRDSFYVSPIKALDYFYSSNLNRDLRNKVSYFFFTSSLNQQFFSSRVFRNHLRYWHKSQHRSESDNLKASIKGAAIHFDRPLKQRMQQLGFTDISPLLFNGGKNKIHFFGNRSSIIRYFSSIVDNDKRAADAYDQLLEIVPQSNCRVEYSPRNRIGRHHPVSKEEICNKCFSNGFRLKHIPSEYLEEQKIKAKHLPSMSFDQLNYVGFKTDTSNLNKDVFFLTYLKQNQSFRRALYLAQLSAVFEALLLTENLEKIFANLLPEDNEIYQLVSSLTRKDYNSHLLALAKLIVDNKFTEADYKQAIDYPVVAQRITREKLF